MELAKEGFGAAFATFMVCIVGVENVLPHEFIDLLDCSLFGSAF